MHDDRVEELKRESLPGLLRELTLQMATLVRQEVELAKTEFRERGKAAAAGAVLIGAAAVLAVAALGAVTTSIIAALAQATPVWSADLIVGVVYAIIALLFALAGKRKFGQAKPLMPQRATQSINEDVEWIKMRPHECRRYNKAASAWPMPSRR